MKQYKYFSSITLVAGMILLSCGASEKKAGATIADTTAVTITNTVAIPPVTSPFYMLLIKHNVSDFSKWITSYNARDSLRRASGVHSHVIARGMEDLNTVLIVLIADDVAKARQFATDVILDEAMQKGGAKVKPEFMLLDIRIRDTTDNTSTAGILVTNKVKDWDLWKRMFDNNKQARVDAGIMDRAVGYDVDNNHMVTMIFTITDMVKARAFMNSQDLRNKMEEAGIEGDPVAFMYNVVERY
jgi:hypothetical protein